tara:strand:- start:2588 stop:4090 length:1503 start_codon:yes stop_codon:yes gene_type:complete
MRLLDLFSGIGGFHKGFEQAGFEFDWVGFSEIDKYASAVYKHRFPNAKELGDVNLIQPKRLPSHIDFLCGGFPCQAFSMAGKRKGFDDTRGTLFFEIARILKYFREHRKPIDYFVLENVKGLLSHDSGRTFATIYRVLTDIGYTVEFQLLNTRWFLPQNRERIYLVGYIGSGRGSKVFPIGEDGKQTKSRQQVARCISRGYEKRGNQEFYIEQMKVADYRNDEGLRVRKESISPTLATRKHSATDISTMPPFVWKETKLKKVGDLQITAKKRSHDTPKEINEYLKANKHGKTIQDIATNLSLPKTQVEHYFRSDKSRAVPSPEHWLLLKEYLGFDDTYDKHVTEIYEKEVEFEASRRVYSSEGISKTLDTHESGYCQVKYNYGSKSLNKTLEKENLGKNDIKALDLYNHKAQDIAPTLTDGKHATLRLYERSNIRRLTPTECERLQGFPDGWTSEGVMNGKVVPMSDTQRYKQCGNAVTVNVVQTVAEKLRPLKCIINQQ